MEEFFYKNHISLKNSHPRIHRVKKNKSNEIRVREKIEKTVNEIWDQEIKATKRKIMDLCCMVHDANYRQRRWFD